MGFGIIGFPAPSGMAKPLHIFQRDDPNIFCFVVQDAFDGGLRHAGFVTQRVGCDLVLLFIADPALFSLNFLCPQPASA